MKQRFKIKLERLYLDSTCLLVYDWSPKHCKNSNTDCERKKRLPLFSRMLDWTWCSSEQVWKKLFFQKKQHIDVNHINSHQMWRIKVFFYRPALWQYSDLKPASTCRCQRKLIRKTTRDFYCDITTDMISCNLRDTNVTDLIDTLKQTSIVALTTPE